MLNGHSKFSIKLIHKNNGLYVRKESDILESARLIKQKNKQIGFDYLVNTDSYLKNHFEIPEVISEGVELNKYYFTMPFYQGNSIIEIIESNNLLTFKTIIDKLFDFINYEIKIADRYERLPIDLLTAKLTDLNSKIDDYLINNIIDNVIRKLPMFNVGKIPMGYCHGDFTFANMIFGEKIILLDFLDSFIGTPLQDIAKLLQEINLKWSLLMHKETVDVIKIKIAYDYLQTQVNNKLEEFLYIHKIPLIIIKLFYLITLLRILPYTDDVVIYNNLKIEIMKVWEEMS